jgi:hypothetical protein
VATAVLAVSALYNPSPAEPLSARSPAPPPPTRRHPAPADPLVRAPVRIADAATVRLLRPGDHVDVLAAARVVATAVTVVEVPEESSGLASTSAYADEALPSGVPGTAQGSGALVVLSVPRHVAAALSGASATSPLAVALC